MPPDLFWMITTGLAHGDVECWMRPAARSFLGGRWIDAVGPRRDGRAVRRNPNLEGKRESGADVCYRLREHVRELSQDLVQLIDDNRSPTRDLQIKRDFAHVWRQAVPYLWKSRELVGAQSFEQSKAVYRLGQRGLRLIAWQNRFIAQMENEGIRALWWGRGLICVNGRNGNWP